MKHAPEPIDSRELIARDWYDRAANDDWLDPILEVSMRLRLGQSPSQAGRDVARILYLVWSARNDAGLISEYARAIQRAEKRHEQRRRIEAAIEAKERALPSNVIGLYSWLRAKTRRERSGGDHAL
jgi:hypothetical protein